MSVEADELITRFGNDQVQKIFRAIHQRLNISVDFNSRDPGGQQFWSQLETELVQSLEIDSIDDIETARGKLSQMLETLVKEEKISILESEFVNMVDQFMDHYFGLGVLDALLRDDSKYGIMVNSCQEIYYEQKGRMQKDTSAFGSDAHFHHVVERLCIRNNADLPSSTHPVVMFPLPDGSSVTIVCPPVSSGSLSLTIGRPAKRPITMEQLIQFGSVSVEMLQFLKAAIEAKLNILVCGYAGSGITTVINILSSFIPGDERVVSIEYEKDYSLKVNHLVKLIATDDPSYSYIKLLKLAEKLRCDLLVLGEFSIPDAYDVLNSVNDSFSGSIVKVVAKSPVDAVNRLETFIQQDRSSLPVAKINMLIGSSIDLIVYQERLQDGSRVIKNIVEVLDKLDSDDRVVVREIFGVEQMGIQNGRIIRKFRSHGTPSGKIMERIKAAGINLPADLFSSSDGDEETNGITNAERRAIKFSRGKYAFISYSKDDRDRVRTLVKTLEDNGFDIWMDVYNIKPGEEWTKILEGAIKDAGVFLAVLTPSAVKSQFVRNEIIMAQDEKIPIIPVKLDECDIPIQIRALQYIPYDKHNVPATIEVISETLSKFISNKQLIGDI